MHLKQHLILKALMTHGYVGIDPGSKVCYLNAGIKTIQLDAVRTRIISDEGLRMDFSRCINLYKDFVKQSAQTTNVHTLTELEDEYGIDDVVHDEPEISDEQRAILAANNSEMDFSSVPTKVTGGEVIEILEDDEEDILKEYK